MKIPWRILFCSLAIACLCLPVPGCRRHKSASSPLADGISALDEGRPDEAAAKLREAVKEQPENGLAYYQLGVACFKASRWDEAAVAFEKATTLLEEDPAPPEFLGQTYMRLERWPDADRVLHEADRRNPGNARVLTTLGVISLKSNRVRDAESFLLQALQADAKYPAALYDLAFLKYKWLAQPDEAKKYFEMFVPLSDDAKRTASARQALANIGATRKTAPATAAASARTPQQAAKKEPSSQSKTAGMAVSSVPASGAPVVARGGTGAGERKPASGADRRQAAVAETKLGVECFRGNSVVEAVDHFKRAISADSTYDVAHYNLGLAYEAQGKTADAIGSFREASRIRPDKADAAYALANAYWKSGNMKSAATVLENLIRMDPNYAKAHFLLGLISEGVSGGRESARQHYERYLALQKTGAHADYARKWLTGYRTGN